MNPSEVCASCEHVYDMHHYGTECLEWREHWDAFGWCPCPLFRPSGRIRLPVVEVSRG